ncbi:MAG: hypothetical protein QME64_07545, partial [bacterium]|nr:hypothetical protein [bacterium]
MKNQIIAPQENLINKIISLLDLESETRDLSQSLIIFPGKRPAHFLRKQLAQKLESSFIPPRIFSIDDLINFVYEEKLNQHNRLLDATDAIALLYDLHKKSQAKLGKDQFLEPDIFFPLGLKLFSDLEELYIESVPVEKVKQIDLMIKDIPAPTLARLQSFSYFYAQFYPELGKKHYSTRSARYQTVAEQINLTHFAEFTKIIFAGFYALTTAEKKIFQALQDSEKTTFIFQSGPGLDEQLKHFGVNQNPNYESRLPNVKFYKSPDKHGQVFAVHSVLSNHKPEEYLTEKNVIVLPTSETVFPLLHHTLSAYDESEYNISLGYPLHRTPIYGFFNSLIELISSIDEDGRIYIPRYIEFILHPYTKNIYFKNRTDITRIIFHTIEEYLIQQGTRTFWSLSELESDMQIKETIRQNITTYAPEITDMQEIFAHLHTIHQKTIGWFSTFSTIGELALKAKSLLTYIYENSTARLHQFFYPYSESFLDAFDTLSRSLLNELSFTERTSYFILFR